MHPCRDFALVFPSTLFLSCYSGGSEGQIGGVLFLRHPYLLLLLFIRTPSPVFFSLRLVLQPSFSSLFNTPSAFFIHFLATSLFLLIVHEGDFFPACIGGVVICCVHDCVCCCCC